MSRIHCCCPGRQCGLGTYVVTFSDFFFLVPIFLGVGVQREEARVDDFAEDVGREIVFIVKYTDCTAPSCAWIVPLGGLFRVCESDTSIRTCLVCFCRGIIIVLHIFIVTLDSSARKRDSFSFLIFWTQTWMVAALATPTSTKDTRRKWKFILIL